MLRRLTQKVMMACIDGEVGRYVLNGDRLRNFGVIVLKKYLDDVDEREKINKELEALFGLQALVSQLEHPNKLLHNVFDVVYDCDLVSEVSLITLRLLFSKYNHLSRRTLSWSGRRITTLRSRTGKELP